MKSAFKLLTVLLTLLIIIQCKEERNLTILSLNEDEDHYGNELQQFLSNWGITFKRSKTGKGTLVGYSSNDTKYYIKVLKIMLSHI